MKVVVHRAMFILICFILLQTSVQVQFLRGHSNYGLVTCSWTTLGLQLSAYSFPLQLGRDHRRLAATLQVLQEF